MGGIKRFFKALEESRVKQVVFFCVSMVVIIALYFPCMFQIRKNKEIENLQNQKVTNDYKITYDVDYVQVDEKENQLIGWIIRTDSENAGLKALLSATDGSSRVVLHTEMERKEAPNTYFLSDWNYGNDSFSFVIKDNDIKDEKCYMIELEYEFIQEEQTDEGITENVYREKIATGKYLYNGKLYNYNPLDFLDDTNKEYEDAFSVDNLQFYSNELGCWIYLCENKMFLLVNEKFGLSTGNNMKIKLHVYTPQTNLLPESRQQYGFLSSDFVFDENEVEYGVEGYRLAMVTLPQDIYINCIEMGLYESSKEMIRDFSFLLTY